MKVYCSKNELMENINIVSRAVSARTPLPILECILLTADERGFTLLANDMEIGIETAPIESVIEEQGSVAIEAKLLAEIVRKLPESEVLIKSDEINVTVIKSGKSEFKIIGSSGDEFPFLPLIEKSISYKLNSARLKNMIRQTLFSVSTDESRPALTGELFEIKNGTLNLVSVDGFRVSVRSAEVNFDGGDRDVIIPSKTLNEISRILPNEEDAEITIFFTDRHALMELGKCTVVSRLLDGNFIKYGQAFKMDSSIKIDTDREYFLNSLERASLVSREVKKSPVNLVINDSILTIISQTELGRSYEEIPIEATDKELKISFNPKYLIDVCRAIESERIILEFSTNLSPCIVKGNDGIEYKYLVLPLRG